MALPTWRINSCMGFIPLHKGTVITGVFILFCKLFELAKLIFQLLASEHLLERCRTSLNKTYDDDDDDRKHAEIKLMCPHGLVIIRNALGMRVVLVFIYILLTLIMINGARQKKPKLMTPWLWWQLVFFLLNILGMIAYVNLPSIPLNLSLLMMDLYYFLVVNSYYLQLTQEGSQPSDVTVLAVSHPRSEMRLVMPAPLKNDPPPPYPGLPSYCGPNVNLDDQVPPYPDNSPSYPVSTPHLDDPPSYPATSSATPASSPPNLTNSPSNLDSSPVNLPNTPSSYLAISPPNLVSSPTYPDSSLPQYSPVRSSTDTSLGCMVERRETRSSHSQHHTVSPSEQAGNDNLRYEPNTKEDGGSELALLVSGPHTQQK